MKIENKSFLIFAVLRVPLFRLSRYASIRTSSGIKGITPVHLAAYHNLEKLIVILPNRNNDPNAKDSEGGTPLSWAIMCGHKATIEILLQRSNVSVSSAALYMAVFQRDQAIIELLLARL